MLSTLAWGYFGPLLESTLPVVAALLLVYAILCIVMGSCLGIRMSVQNLGTRSVCQWPTRWRWRPRELEDADLERGRSRTPVDMDEKWPLLFPGYDQNPVIGYSAIESGRPQPPPTGSQSSAPQTAGYLPLIESHDDATSRRDNLPAPQVLRTSNPTGHIGRARAARSIICESCARLPENEDLRLESIRCLHA